ncbi:hypothetical protein TRAPUB_2752 [Trametes pubescens]|uniref:C2H2-type domain-containing protein n=1 Tax=Trametes pubescens TaxID=154538 RepID=A0A1M2VFR6_TRAPU|nr:hypothetical protein TRAPUB_2752 [Trametes pubescens]
MSSRASSPPSNDNDLAAMFVPRSPPSLPTDANPSYKSSVDSDQWHGDSNDALIYAEPPHFYLDKASYARLPSPLPYIHDPFLVMEASPDPSPISSVFSSPLLSSACPLPLSSDFPASFALESPAVASETSATTFDLISGDTLDEDELDKYVLSPNEITARAAALQAQSEISSTAHLITTEVDSCAFVPATSAVTPAAAFPGVASADGHGPISTVAPVNRGKKRSRKGSVEGEEDKENEAPEEADKPAGSLTAPAEEPTRKRMKSYDILPALEVAFTNGADVGAYSQPTETSQGHAYSEVENENNPLSTSSPVSPWPPDDFAAQSDEDQAELPDDEEDAATPAAAVFTCGMDEGECTHPITDRIEDKRAHLNARHGTTNTQGRYVCTYSNCTTKKAEGYTDKCNRNKHVISVHWGGWFRCAWPGCSKAYRREDTLSRHKNAKGHV